ncbi:Nucleolar Complex 2 protein [Varicellaria rhodocarpa]|nr:Nucleolar Complex 2 protein [Varicellaria rhodocarpa]
MAGRTKKSTKKFEKNHLQDTIERRKDFAKIKQRQQIKAKKKSRNASDYAKASPSDDDDGAKASAKAAAQQEDRLKDMTVDDFFQGGFDIPEPAKKAGQSARIQKSAKRKRDDQQQDDLDSASDTSDSDRSASNEDHNGSGSGSEGELAEHKEDLDALAQKDPEFYKYLQENDAELLDFAPEDTNLAGSDGNSEGELPKKKRKKGKQVGEKAKKDVEEDSEDGDGTEITLHILEKWKAAMSDQQSLRAMRQVVLAFRAAAHVNEEDGKEFKYLISSPEVYHQLLLIALQNVPHVLAHHLPVKELSTGKVRVATDSKKYRTLTPLLKSHAASVNHLLENLSDAPTIKLTLSAILPLLPYFLSFKKALKTLLKAVVNIWSDPSSDEAARITAFLFIRRLAVISDPSLREAVLKTTYQGLIKGSRTTTSHTISGINLMKNSAVELWGIDSSMGYTTAFTYIRQLAIHLRSSITQPTKDSYKVIYNWQFTHSLDFWSRVLSAHCSTAMNLQLKAPNASPFHPLIYPLVQITLGALRLIPTPTYFPLRFHLTRSLLRISRSTNTYIPLAPSLLEVLSSAEMKKAPKPSTLKLLDFRTILRAPKTYLRTRVYQDGVGEEIVELMAEFFGVWAKSIAFPELTIPPSVLLKRWLKEVSPHSKETAAHNNRNGKRAKGNKNARLHNSLTLLLSKLSANATFVETHRRKLDFAPSNRAGVESFLQDVEWANMPLGAYVTGMRKQREEKERLLEDARREDEVRIRKGEGKEQVGEGEMDVDDDSEEEDEDE